MKAYESIQYAQQHAKTLAQKAHTQFNHAFAYLPASQAKDVFLDLINFLIEREILTVTDAVRHK